MTLGINDDGLDHQVLLLMNVSIRYFSDFVFFSSPVNIDLLLRDAFCIQIRLKFSFSFRLLLFLCIGSDMSLDFSFFFHFISFPFVLFCFVLLLWLGDDFWWLVFFFLPLVKIKRDDKARCFSFFRLLDDIFGEAHGEDDEVEISTQTSSFASHLLCLLLFLWYFFFAKFIIFY